MIPTSEWPLILYSHDVEVCLGIGRTDALMILHKAPVLDPSKKRYRCITKKALLNFLERSEDQ